MRDSQDRNVPLDAVKAIGRFNPDGPTGYRAQPPYAVDAPIRQSRDEAFSDIPHDCPWINGCRCHRDRSLCACTHQKSAHAPIHYVGTTLYTDCDRCECTEFERPAMEAAS